MWVGVTSNPSTLSVSNARVACTFERTEFSKRGLSWSRRVFPKSENHNAPQKGQTQKVTGVAKSQSENEELYSAHKMSKESFVGGSPRSPDTGIPQGGHQDEIENGQLIDL